MDISTTLFSCFKQPSECNTYADIDAVYKCLKEKYGVKDEKLIVYGQSVGSGPTVDIASRVSNLRGVVLHSPILSGMRVLYPVKRTYWFDIYKVILSKLLITLFRFGTQMLTSFLSFQNIDKIVMVNCPVLVIHVSLCLSLLLSFPFSKYWSWVGLIGAIGWCFSASLELKVGNFT